MKLFADDTKTYTALNAIEDVTKLQCTTDNFSDWSFKWGMDFNTKKCKGERYQIQNVTEEKDLGVITDTKLKFDSHISSKINKANRNLGIINRSFTYMDKSMFLNLYKTMVRPHLEYASPVWSPFLRKQQVAIENVQRRTTRLLMNISHLSCKDRLIYLGLPSLECRRKRADMLQVFKILHNYDRVSNKDLLKSSNYSRTRGHNLKLQNQSNLKFVRIASALELLILGITFLMMMLMQTA